MRYLLSILLLLFFGYCNCQQYYETYTPANGLVDARVNKIVQAADGRLFFLTRDGVSIYDGQRFINHTKFADGGIGIVEDAILYPDGSVRLAAFSGNWINFKKNANIPDNVIYKNIPEVSYVINLSAKEHLVATNYGVFMYERSTQIPLIPVKTLSSSQKIVPDNIAVSGQTIVFNYFPDATKVYVADILTGNISDSLATSIVSINNDNKGNIFLCTHNGILQLNKYSLENKKLKAQAPWFQQWIPKNFESDRLFFDNKNNIWLLNNIKGCCKIDPLLNTITFFNTEEGLLPGITGMFQDKEGNYWFIAKGKGVQKLIQTNFETIREIGKQPINNTYALQNSANNGLYLSTGNGEFFLSQNKLTTNSIKRNNSSNNCYAWLNDIWEHSQPGIFVNSARDSLIVPIDNSIKTASHFPSYNIGFDSDNNLIVSGNHFVLLKNKKNSSGISLPYFADNIVQDESKNYWAFCRSNDIVKIKEQNGQMTKLASYIHPGLEARYALHWRSDTFLIGTRYNGIYITTANEKSLNIIGQLSRKNGLSNDFVETLLKIDDHRIAVGTAAGLDIININNNDTSIENLSAKINHFEPIIQLATDDRGMIYARTENYQLFKYNPFFKPSADYTPGAWISFITVNGNKIENNNSRFNYRQNNFAFAISSPSFTNSKSIIFDFILQNEKTSWRQAGNKADFQINNLVPGRYKLDVTIKYPGWAHLNKNINYEFVITPPFWKTWWFITSTAFLLLSVFFITIRSHFKRQLEKQKAIMEKEVAVEHERTRLARELHDGLGSMLSGIKHSFTALQKSISLNEEEKTTFHLNIEKLNESINELRNISHSIYSDSLLKYGLDIVLAEYCKKLSKNETIKINFSSLNMGSVQLTEEQSFHIYRIVQELLQNIFKHSAATEALVQLSYNNKQVYIAVEDNGIGFNHSLAKSNPGIGLKNIESRVKILKGKLDYQTAPGKGTSILIEIPVGEKL